MGGIGQALFGGSRSKSSSESKNVALPFIQNAFGGTAEGTGRVNSALMDLLGIGGDAASQTAAFDRFRNSTGYQSALKGASDAVTSNNASRGLLASGDYGERIARVGSDMAASRYNDYIQQLLGIGNQGLQAGSLISGAGQTSTSNSNSSQKKGMGGFLGSVLAGIPGG